jgi:prepilin-type N-terminal cleavage/methylation domain-containing protein
MSRLTRAVLADRRGFSLTELIVVIAIIGIISLMVATAFWQSFYQDQVLRAGTEVVSTYLQQARSLAIRTGTSICADLDGGSLHLHQGTCAGTVWVGPGTNASGLFPTPQGVTIALTAAPVFNYLGAATPTATYTITNSKTGASRTITVAATGRISVGP